jgi:hypothetical protein
MSKKAKKAKYLFLRCYRPEHYESEPDFAIIELTQDLAEYMLRESLRGIELKKSVTNFSSINISTYTHSPKFLEYSDAEKLFGVKKLGVAEKGLDKNNFHILELDKETVDSAEDHRVEYPKLTVCGDGDVNWVAYNNYSDCELSTSSLSNKDIKEICTKKVWLKSS